MRKIPLTYGLLYFRDELEHSEAALSADPDAQPLAQPFQDALTDWEGTFKSERAARRDVTRAEAVVSVRNVKLDITTRSFSRMVTGVAADLMSRFFTMAPGRFIRRNLRWQAEQTRDVILKALGKLDAGHPLQPFAQPLQDGAKAALDALDHRSAVKGARASVSNDVQEWKEGINALRTTTYAELLKIATAKKYPKEWVESFFRKVESSSGEAGEEEAEGGEDGEGGEE
ncbi:MAG TPA: hypothetical protein VLS89_19465 [Candidatus Nanopelagicales bacterium]|nr:hypothetical protein [Candidatus Nanopelagicales bacterium]